MNLYLAVCLKIKIKVNNGSLESCSQFYSLYFLNFFNTLKAAFYAELIGSHLLFQQRLVFVHIQLYNSNIPITNIIPSQLRKKHIGTFCRQDNISSPIVYWRLWDRRIDLCHYIFCSLALLYYISLACLSSDYSSHLEDIF